MMPEIEHTTQHLRPSLLLLGQTESRAVLETMGKDGSSPGLHC